jgi:vacuolar protein sorting-associated protein 35
MRFTFPALITSSIKLCRRCKNREHLVSINICLIRVTYTYSQISQEDDWKSKVSATIKFARQLISILATQVETPTIALRLFLLAAQIADECGFEDLAYDLYVQAFTVYEESISESRAQLQAVALIIGTLQGSKVFGVDNFDTLITKAALHGAKLLKKPHQSMAVNIASHLWWQEAQTDDVETEKDGEMEKRDTEKEQETEPVKEDGGPRAVRIVYFFSPRHLT